MNIAARPQAQIKGNECKSIVASVQEHKSKKYLVQALQIKFLQFLFPSLLNHRHRSKRSNEYLSLHLIVRNTNTKQSNFVCPSILLGYVVQTNLFVLFEDFAEKKIAAKCTCGQMYLRPNVPQ
jgi:hypothetical protein